MKKFYTFVGFSAAISVVTWGCATRTWPRDIPADSVLSSSASEGPVYEPQELAFFDESSSDATSSPLRKPSSQVHHHEHGHDPENGSQPASPDQYVCPMHPEVVSDKPGSCSVCGMTLEKKESL